MLQSASSASSAASSARPHRLARQQPRPRLAPSGPPPPPPQPPVPRRVVAARRLLTALSKDDHEDDDDLELRPYLWCCGGGNGAVRLPNPPSAWRRLEERLATSSPNPGRHPPRDLLPLLAAPPSALLPERAVLRHAANAGGGGDGKAPTPTRAPCQLSRRGLLSPLRDRELEEFLARLFEVAVLGRRRRRGGEDEGEERGGAADAAAPPPPPPIELSRHDLFHAHLFASSSSFSSSGNQHQSLGLLFHAAEYPRRTTVTAEEEAEEEGAGLAGGADAPTNPPSSSSFPFPYDLGKCQRDSDLEATKELLDWRTLLYFQGRLAAFSVARGGPLKPLLRPGTAPLRTVYEEDLASVGGEGFSGWVGPDVLCFHERDVVDGRELGWGFGGAGGRGTLSLPPLPRPVETSLGPLHVFLSY